MFEDQSKQLFVWDKIHSESSLRYFTTPSKQLKDGCSKKYATNLNEEKSLLDSVFSTDTLSYPAQSFKSSKECSNFSPLHRPLIMYEDRNRLPLFFQDSQKKRYSQLSLKQEKGKIDFSQKFYNDDGGKKTSECMTFESHPITFCETPVNRMSDSQFWGKIKKQNPNKNNFFMHFSSVQTSNNQKNSLKDTETRCELPVQHKLFPMDPFQSVPCSTVASTASCISTPNTYRQFQHRFSDDTSRPRSGSFASDYTSLHTSPFTSRLDSHLFHGTFSNQSLTFDKRKNNTKARLSLSAETSLVYKKVEKKKEEESKLCKSVPKNKTDPILYAVIDSQFEKLCRDILPSLHNFRSQFCYKKSAPDNLKMKPGETALTPKKRNRVIFCRICNEVKPRSTRARFQSCNHIACYDCVRIALHVEFWAVKINLSKRAPRAVCPVCLTPLDWSSIKPYIVLAEESKYSPVLSLAFTGNGLPVNASCQYKMSPPNTSDTSNLSSIPCSDEPQYEQVEKRLKKTYNILKSFFPVGIDIDLILSDHCNIFQTCSGQCVNTLLGLPNQTQNNSTSAVYVDLLETWRKEMLFKTY